MANKKKKTPAPKKQSQYAKNWRPPGWLTQDEGVDFTPDESMKWHAKYKKLGYFTKGGALSEEVPSRDAADVEIVRHNYNLLRDAWNTYEGAWTLAEKLTGIKFLVDPFSNPGTQGLSSLVVKLDGSGDQENETRKTSGLAVSKKTVEISLPEFVNGKVEDRVIELSLPLNWRGYGSKRLPQGGAPVAANGPHSRTEKWLKLCAAQGQEEIVAAFIPSNGDRYAQQWGMTAQLSITLGRVPCIEPPGLTSSSPRGASALLIWVPKALVPSLPKPARECIEKGVGFLVPFIDRPIAGLQHAIVQPGEITKIVDLGLLA